MVFFGCGSGFKLFPIVRISRNCGCANPTATGQKGVKKFHGLDFSRFINHLGI